jgi:hypothetical protein
VKWGKVWVPVDVFRRLVRAKRAGIVYPFTTYREARRAGLDYALACSLLIEETGGGTNEFGHDPTIWVGAGKVTKRKYVAYKAERIRSGNRLMQGVGPCQLTWWSTQDHADLLGGCWKPRFNMRVGFGDLASNIHTKGLFWGVAAYNGAGPAAVRYAEQVIARYQEFKDRGI